MPKRFRAYRRIVNILWNVTVQMWHTDNRKREYISLSFNVFILSIVIEKSRRSASEVEMFSFLSCNSEEYIFLKLLSSFIWSFMTHKSSVKQNVLRKRRVLRKFLFNI